MILLVALSVQKSFLLKNYSKPILSVKQRQKTFSMLKVVITLFRMEMLCLFALMFSRMIAALT